MREAPLFVRFSVSRRGFKNTFTSPAAFHQALVVQAITVGLVLFILGIASNRVLRTARYSDAVWIANSVTVGLGFVAYKWLYHALHSPNYLPEYDSPLILVIFPWLLLLSLPDVFTLEPFASKEIVKYLDVIRR